MSSSPDKTDARSMSDILASIRQIMAQDPAPAAKPAAKGADGSPRPGLRLPTPDASREPSMRDQAPREQPSLDQPPPREKAKPVAPAPAPTPAPASAPSAAAAPASSAAKPPADAPAPAARTAAPLTADQPVSLDEFLALAAPPKEVITTPIVAAPVAEPVKPAAKIESTAPTAPTSPSAGGAPAWLFPRPQATDEGKEAATKEPAPAPTPTPAQPAIASPSVAKVETPPAKAPMTGSAPTSGKEAGPSPARSAPPPPRLLGDLGSVVPGRFDGQAAEGSSRRFGAPSLEPNDRYSPVAAPAPRPTPTPPSRPETSRAVPAPDIAPAFETEIPGADALRRLIADVVPPSSLAPSAPARTPAPNSDDVRTEIVLPVQAKAPDAVTVPDPSPAPVTEPTPVAKQAEPAPVPPTAKAEPSAKPIDPAPVAVAAPVEPTLTPGPSVAASAARTMDETVVELLRPLLRDWLNTNMPRLIEPALKAELEAMRGVVAKDKKD